MVCSVWNFPRHAEEATKFQLALCFKIHFVENIIMCTGLRDSDEDISEDDSDVEPILRSDDEDFDGMQPFA